MSAKLTAPQFALLKSISDGNWHHSNADYKPCSALLSRGLAVGRNGKYGGFSIQITDLGREALK